MPNNWNCFPWTLSIQPVQHIHLHCRVAFYQPFKFSWPSQSGKDPISPWTMSGKTNWPGTWSHRRGESFWHQPADEEHTLASCCVVCQHLAQTENTPGIYPWSRDVMDTTAPLNHTVLLPRGRIWLVWCHQHKVIMENQINAIYWDKPSQWQQTSTYLRVCATKNSA